jgi:hypothetical protein
MQSRNETIARAIGQGALTVHEGAQLIIEAPSAEWPQFLGAHASTNNEPGEHRYYGYPDGVYRIWVDAEGVPGCLFPYAPWSLWPTDPALDRIRAHTKGGEL